MKKEIMLVVAMLLSTSPMYAEEAPSGNERTIQYTFTITRDESGYDVEQWNSLVKDACSVVSRANASDPEELLQNILEKLQAFLTKKASDDGIHGQLTLSVSDRVCNCDDDCGCKIRSNGICECTALNECTKSCSQDCSSKNVTACSQGCMQTACASE